MQAGGRDAKARRAAGGRRPEASAKRVRAGREGPPAAAGAAGVGADPGSAAPAVPGAAGPRGGSVWAGLPEDLLVKVARTLVSQDEARWAAKLKRWDWSEGEIQEIVEERKREGSCLFVFALVCKGWRKAQLKVGGPLCTWVWSDVILPGSVALAKWALAEGCPRENKGGVTMALAAAEHGHLELVKWLCGEGGFEMDEQVMWGAAQSGNLKLVQWLRGEGCPWDYWTCSQAVDRGRVEMLRWVRENGCPWTAGTEGRAAAELGYTDDLGNLVADDDYDYEF